VDLLNMLTQAGGGTAVGQLARQFGLSEDQAQSALGALAPALAKGFQRNMASEGGLESLLGALAGGQHQRYLDDSDSLGAPETAQDGNGILGHIFGSKDVSRSVAARAAEQTGIGGDVLKKMLPVVAAMAMGALSNRNAAGVGGEGLLGMLTQGLDADGDGSVLDDVMGIAGKFFQR
jgi:hypothetical protein